MRESDESLVETLNREIESTETYLRSLAIPAEVTVSSGGETIGVLSLTKRGLFFVGRNPAPGDDPIRIRQASIRIRIACALALPTLLCIAEDALKVRESELREAIEAAKGTRS